MHGFYLQNDIFTIYENDGNGRKTPKEKVKIEQNKYPFGFLPIPYLWNLRLSVFLSPRGPKTSQPFPSRKEKLS